MRRNEGIFLLNPPSLARWPLLLPATGWSTGIALVYADIISLPWLPLAAVVLALCAVPRPGRAFCIGACVGLFWAGAFLLWQARAMTVDAGWIGRPVWITGDVRAVQGESGRFRLTLDGIVRDDGTVLTGAVLVSWYASADEARSLDLHEGERIRLQARFRQPENFRNPGFFDYRSFCFDRGIALTGTIRGKPEAIATTVGLLDAPRRRIRESLAAAGMEEAGVILALLLADRSLLATHVSDAFAASGAAHLLAISGLHVGLVAGWGFFACRWLLTRREAWIVHLPIQRIALASGLSAAVAYAALAGWPLPTQRAVLLLGAAVLAWWLRLRTSPVNTLLAALILILCWNPAAIASASLWLSFTATAALLVWAGQQDGKPQRPARWILAMLWVSLVATLATLPLIAVAFERIATYALIANALLVPMFSLLILPFALLGELAAISGLQGLAEACMQLSAQALKPGLALIDRLYTWPGARLFLPSPGWWSGVFYAAGMIAAGRLWWLSRRGLALGTAALVLGLYLLVVLPERPPQEAVYIAWDVGQGSASSLLLPDGTVLAVDAPGYPGSRFNGGSTVAAGLRALGLVHIDVLVLSHAQRDHMGGADRLLEQVRRTGEIWLADIPENHEHPAMRRLIARLQKDGATVRWLARGDLMRLGPVRASVLWPPRGFDPRNANNASLVLSLSIPGGNLLLPADIEKQAERSILAGGISGHDLTLIPHHGSMTSSTRPWVTAVDAMDAVAQAGRGNAYGFPKPEIVRRYVDHGSRVWNTADGAVFASIGEEGWRVRQWKPSGVDNRFFALQWWAGHL